LKAAAAHVTQACSQIDKRLISAIMTDRSSASESERKKQTKAAVVVISPLYLRKKE
jgi:hypothetical protein